MVPGQVSNSRKIVFFMEHRMPSEPLADLLQHGYRYALSLTHDPSRAEDLLHEAWIAVLRAGGPPEKGYLFSAIRTRFLNHNKRERLVPFVPLDEFREEEGDQAHAPSGSHFDQGNLEGALATLRPVEREALYLSVVEGYTADEIAKRTKQPRGSVLSLIHRSKQKLRRFFGYGTRKVKP